MTIYFPHKEEVQLAFPPLTEVVCQVRIPPILQIAKEIPSEFQEAVIDRFPQLDFEQGVQVVLPGLVEGEEPLTRAKPKIYRFKNEDENAVISLAADFYSLSHYQYQHWSDFAADLQLAHETMLEIYKPKYATRIGLRYINRLTSDNTDFNSKEELFDLLRPELTAILRNEVGANVGTMSSTLSFYDVPAQLNLRFAFDDLNQISFVLDFDYFERGKLPLEELIDRCNNYHEVIYDSFRWCLVDETLESFRLPSEEE
jgi:uncharacterized protein (TIGR04255 family)